MRLPRDISGKYLVSKLQKLGYEPIRQTGSHLRLSYKQNDSVHNVTIPLHDNLRIGTLNSILVDVAQNLGITREDLLLKLAL